MMDLTDTPLLHKKISVRRKAAWAGFVVLALILTALSWGDGVPVRFGDPAGLDVQVEFMGSRMTGSDGALVFNKGQIMAYRIVVANHSNTSINNLEMQSWLQTEDGRRLTGPSLSPIHRTSLSPGQTYQYEAEYDIPPTLSAPKSYLQFHGQYLERGAFKVDTFLCRATPLSFE